MRLLEHYISPQGEGPRTGTPTQFIRFAGCNLRCPGWPCDTPFAINPQIWRSQYESVSAAELLNRIEKKLLVHSAYNLCLTGGEPLLQGEHALIEVARSAVRFHDATVEVFTNGSRPIPLDLARWATFVMDWKLLGSGEHFSEEYQKVRLKNLETMISDVSPFYTMNSVKFVCKSWKDYEAAREIYESLSLDGWPGLVYFGVVWDAGLPASMMVDDLIASPPGRNWRLNVQTHNYIFDPQERGR